MQLEPRRGRRRRLTETVARRRRSDYIRLMLSGHRWAETSSNFWAKTSIGSCSCCKTASALQRDQVTDHLTGKKTTAKAYLRGEIDALWG